MQMETHSWCDGQLQGDPDVAGRGVLCAIWTTTCLAVAVSWSLWYIKIFCRHDSNESTLYQGLLKCAFMLADIQLVTALAITISSIILIHSEAETSLYHIFIARSLAQANLTGHGAALMFDTRMQANWTARMALLIWTIGLYLYWSYISLGAWEAWSNVTPHCFWNDTWISYGWYTFWIKLDIPWMLLGYFWVFCEAAGVFNEEISNRLIDLDQWTQTAWRDSWKLVWSIWIQRAHMTLLSAFSNILGAVIRLIMVFALTITIGPPSTTPFSCTLYFFWSTTDAETARSANRGILVAQPAHNKGLSLQGNENPENDWGFGQILPMCLLILPLLQIWDNFSEPPSHSKRTAAYYLGQRHWYRHRGGRQHTS